MKELIAFKFTIYRNDNTVSNWVVYFPCTKAIVNHTFKKKSQIVNNKAEVNQF
jgi:hypothetical protein